MKHSITITLLLLCVSFTGRLSAESAERGWFFEQSVGASQNPLGFESTSTVYYSIPLNTGTGELWESTKLEIGAENSFTPADNRILAYFNIEPIAIFDISMRAGYYQAYKVFNNGLIPRSSYNDSFSTSAIDKAHQENKNGIWADAAPRFKVKIGSVIFAHTLTFNYIHIRNNPDGYFYEPHQDAIVKNTDYSIYNSSYLLYAINDNIMLGCNHFIMNIPRSGYSIETVTAVENFSMKISHKTEFSVALQEGTHIKNKYYRHKFYCAGEIGISIKL
jgi:hypothetical protein